MDAQYLGKARALEGKCIGMDLAVRVNEVRTDGEVVKF